MPTRAPTLGYAGRVADRANVLIVGRVAEEVIFDEITTGASDDLEKATNVARTMVTRYGMSEKLGPRTFGKKE